MYGTLSPIFQTLFHRIVLNGLGKYNAQVKSGKIYLILENQIPRLYTDRTKRIFNPCPPISVGGR